MEWIVSIVVAVGSGASWWFARRDNRRQREETRRETQRQLEDGREETRKQIEAARRTQLVDRRLEVYTAMVAALTGVGTRGGNSGGIRYTEARAAFSLLASKELVARLGGWEEESVRYQNYLDYANPQLDPYGELMDDYRGTMPEDLFHPLKEAIRGELDDYSAEDRRLELGAVKEKPALASGDEPKQLKD